MFIFDANRDRGAATGVIVGVIVVILIIIGLVYLGNRGEEKNEEAMEVMSFDLIDQVTQAMAGSVEVSDEAGRAKVVLALSSADASAHPAHIHSGTCSNPGGIVIPLSDVSGGRGETFLNNSLEDLEALFASGPYLVNVHKSAAELGVYLGCADLTVAGDVEGATTETPAMEGGDKG